MGTFLDVRTIGAKRVNDVLFCARLGRYFVASGDALYELSLEGELLAVFRTESISGARGIAVSPANTPDNASGQCRSSEVGLLSPSGRRNVGDQLQAFTIDADGIISSPKPAWINLYYTENKPFRLSGAVWLGGEADALLFPGDIPNGFALYYP